MNNKSRYASIALVAALVTFGASTSIADDDKVSLENLAVSMEQATALALQQVPGTVVGAEVESEDDTLVWEVEVQTSSGETFEIEIDAVSAEVLEVEQED